MRPLTGRLNPITDSSVPVVVIVIVVVVVVVLLLLLLLLSPTIGDYL